MTIAEKVQNETYLEHINVTVIDVEKTAETYCKLFGWKVRWKGDSIHGGTSIHVGGEGSYLAIYENGNSKGSTEDTYHRYNGLNHIGVVVDDLDDVEKRIVDLGYITTSHADYEPGRRFYFDDENGIEIEVISYN
jgi:catechol 2,3-dioxygenase-like lactoylglutathione lyase family enzyme